MTIIDTPEGINAYHILSMVYAIKLESLGMKNSRGSVYALAKRKYNLKGNRESVMAQLRAMLPPPPPSAS